MKRAMQRPFYIQEPIYIQIFPAVADKKIFQVFPIPVYVLEKQYKKI